MTDTTDGRVIDNAIDKLIASVFLVMASLIILGLVLVAMSQYVVARMVCLCLGHVADVFGTCERCNDAAH